MGTKKKIYDKDIRPSNYGTFRRCSIVAQGKEFKFVYACGAEYIVPIYYFIKWNATPHLIYKNGRWVDWHSSNDRKTRNKNRLLFVHHRRIVCNRIVRVYLNNGTAFDIPWDTVLMACEKRYEYFGGLTKESKKIVAEFFK